MISRNIGKNTIGDNNKMKVEMRTYNRSTHDLSYIWRNTQAVGTLVPFMNEVALPGDTHEIQLEASVLTHPTVGPLFGTFKLQMDIFSCPLRLYNGWLHNNKLNVGLKMANVKLPQLEQELMYPMDRPTEVNEFIQIHPSCLLAYLGIRGYTGFSDEGEVNQKVTKNAVPFLAYWDIFKNYYANRQETMAYFINNNYAASEITLSSGVTPIKKWFNLSDNITFTIVSGQTLTIIRAKSGVVLPTLIRVKSPTGVIEEGNISILGTVTDATSTITVTFSKLIGYTFLGFHGADTEIQLSSFPLENIDKMRENILYHNNATPFKITSGTISPYGDIMKRIGAGKLRSSNIQMGLALKTYNSDIFNNWIKTEFIDGENGINAITAIDTSGDSFTLDTLNLAKKVYDMLNRIAISGGSYNDWMQTVYAGADGLRLDAETPVFEGGASQEIGFQEVVSTAAQQDEPLGTLAGRGTTFGKQNGGTIKIKSKEIGYIMGIVSITPRIDYNQGNRFDTTFETMDDFHKPALDGIGFQDLVTDKMAYWDTHYHDNKPQYRAVGKQPAWLDYMTNFNRTYGNFAIRSNEGFMVLNRNYEMHEEGVIRDTTTYIDPAKFNYIFADTSLDSMNFWVQIKVDIKARRLISAKSIPNL